MIEEFDEVIFNLFILKFCDDHYVYVKRFPKTECEYTDNITLPYFKAIKDCFPMNELSYQFPIYGEFNYIGDRL